MHKRLFISIFFAMFVDLKLTGSFSIEIHQMSDCLQMETITMKIMQK